MSLLRVSRGQGGQLQDTHSLSTMTINDGVDDDDDDSDWGKR